MRMGFERASEGLQPELVREMLGTLDAVRPSSVNQLALTRALRDLRRAFLYLPAQEVWEVAARHHDREVLLELVAGGEMEGPTRRNGSGRWRASRGCSIGGS